ncbi:MAG: acyl carrier protein [Acidimicrobiales bacterium]
MTESASTLEPDLLSMITDEITYGVPVDADTDLLLTELVDSLGVIRIVAWLEQRLGVEIDPGDVVIENFQSVRKMLDYVSAR